eukprot:TRINITY_DN3238_c0_g2_i2.p1 TRINITY_DN3238_c0_g2~~TRINITY_DN3238_c0_g2_i2.p1  ORF type:complete len:283 (-),score=59.32 TRINITY_DN3238_c0_g2_i2:77-925(-)
MYTTTFDLFAKLQKYRLETEPELFYGFWGGSFNVYRSTTPHEGYSIIQKWKKNYFSEPKFPFSQVPDLEDLLSEKSTTFTREDVTGMLGPFYSITSNVDAHLRKAGFSRNEVHEIHGNIETWQCSKACEKNLWTAPSQYSFQVDENTLLANIDFKQLDPQNSDFLFCPACGSRARPSILMFYDMGWVEESISNKIWSFWEKSVREELNANPEKKVVVLEIGCGNVVPTIRVESEHFVGIYPKQSTLIRVNMDFPFADNKKVQVLSILGKGLDTLKAIDRYLK